VSGMRESRNLAQTQMKTLETNLTAQLDKAALRLEGLAKQFKG
jgi:hypothetical protein